MKLTYCACPHGLGWTHCERCGAPLRHGIGESDWKAEQLVRQAEIREQYRRVERRQNLEAALLALAIFVGAVIAGILWRS